VYGDVGGARRHPEGFRSGGRDEGFRRDRAAISGIPIPILNGGPASSHLTIRIRFGTADYRDLWPSSASLGQLIFYGETKIPSAPTSCARGSS
jgi:hypothetical protein